MFTSCELVRPSIDFLLHFRLWYSSIFYGFASYWNGGILFQMSSHPDTEALLSGYESQRPSSEQDDIYRRQERYNMEARAEHQKIKQFNVYYGFTTILGTGLVFLVIFWLLNYRGGFSWSSNPMKQFNWHPFLMILSLVFLYSQSILVYRFGRKGTKQCLKLSHGLIHLTAFILAVIGLQAVFSAHNNPAHKTANMYTLHSWVGLITVIIFSGQLLIGCVAFFYPRLSLNLRKAILPYHTKVGITGFILATISALMGLSEKAIFSLGEKYQTFIFEGVLINLIGLIIIAFGISTVYLVIDPDYKRTNTAEDEMGLAPRE